MKAAVQEGIVVDIHPEDGYECHSSITWVDCSDEVKHGWTYDGKTFTTNEPQLTAEEELERLRAERNSRLSQTDHWALSDTATMTQAQTDYRQELRDITKTYKSLDEVKWPTAPEEAD